MTVAPLRGGDPNSYSTLSFEALRKTVGAQRPSTAGMIFHTGRCGSTLLSRMIGHDPTALVLREAGTLSAFHGRARASTRVPTFALEQAFLDLLVIHERFATDIGRQRLVVKHPSWLSASMGRLAELLPDTPFVFVHRDPIAVVESSLDGHPGWSASIHEPRHQLLGWLPGLHRCDSTYTAADIYASAWAAGAHSALTLAPERILIVDYEQLASSPDQTLRAVQRHLAITATLDIESALTELRTYSKAPGEVEFQPELTDAHPSLSKRTARRVSDIVGDLPDRLAERRTSIAS